MLLKRIWGVPTGSPEILQVFLDPRVEKTLRLCETWMLIGVAASSRWLVGGNAELIRYLCGS